MGPRLHPPVIFMQIQAVQAMQELTELLETIDVHVAEVDIPGAWNIRHALAQVNIDLRKEYFPTFLPKTARFLEEQPRALDMIRDKCAMGKMSSYFAKMMLQCNPAMATLLRNMDTARTVLQLHWEATENREDGRGKTAEPDLASRRRWKDAVVTALTRAIEGHSLQKEETGK